VTYPEPRSRSGKELFVVTVQSKTHAALFFQKDSTASNREVAKEPMRRKLLWTESLSFQGWACSECAWVFNSSWPLVGKSIEEMKTSFVQERDEEFASHVCAEHPRAAKNPD